MTDSLDLYSRIESLEGALAQAQVTLTRLRAVVPQSGCAVPAHADAVGRLNELEEELRNLRAGPTRGRRTTERIEQQRRGTLQAEISRLSVELSTRRPQAKGDPSLLAKLKAARERKFVLEKLRQAAPVVMVGGDDAMSLAPIESPHRSWVADLIVGIGTYAAFGLLTPIASIAAVCGLIAASFSVRWAFPGAKVDLVTADTIYGTRWQRVDWISFETDGRLVIKTGRRKHVFHAGMPGFNDVVGLARVAAAKHSIKVIGTPPNQLALPAGPHGPR